MVRNGDKVEAYTWSAAERTWVNVGTVVDAVGSGRKRLYNGKEYDFVFDVDIQEGQPPLKLPYNASENPFDAARRFLEDNELPLSYLDTVGNFIVQNSQGVSLGGQSESGGPDPWGSEQRYRPGDANRSASSTPAAPAPTPPRFLPHTEYLTITTANLALVEKKVNELNQQLVNDGHKDLSLNPEELQTISGLCAFLQKASSSSKPQSSPEVLDGLQILVKIITSWPVQQRLPALDLLRLIAAASPIAAEYKAGDADLLTVITDSGSVSAQYANNTMLTVRAFVNMFQTDAGKNYVDQKYEEVSYSNISAHLTELTQYKILELVKNAAKDTTNRNLKIAEATLLLK